MYESFLHYKMVKKVTRSIINLISLKWIIAAFFLIQSISLIALAEIPLAIPKEDRAQLEALFKYLCYKNTFAYVLFGTKPMSMTSEMKGKHSDFELELAWKTWEKYSHLFDIKDFEFFTNSNEDWFSIFIINKKRGLQVIEENLSLFHDRLGCQSSPAEILKKIVKGEDVGNIGLNYSHTLLDVLFGFGTKNAIGFERYRGCCTTPV